MKFNVKANQKAVTVSDRRRRLRSYTACARQRVSISSKGESRPKDDDWAKYLEVMCVDDEEDDEDDGDVDVDYQTFLKNLREDGKSYVFETVDSEDGTPVYVKYEGEDDEVESESPRSWGNVSSPKSGQFVVCSSRPDFEYGNNDMDPSLVDDSYEAFISHVRMQGHSMVLELESGAPIVYEEEENEDSGSTKSPVSCVKQELVYDDDETSIESISCGSINCDDRPCFEGKLVKILRKPFKRNEYYKLLKEATSHRPSERHRDLRGRSVSYATEKSSHSYLDYYPDLARQLQSADRRRRLTLLRGFFFWLQNLSHNGAYTPWHPPSSCYEKDCEKYVPIVID